MYTYMTFLGALLPGSAMPLAAAVGRFGLAPGFSYISSCEPGRPCPVLPALSSSHCFFRGFRTPDSLAPSSP